MVQQAFTRRILAGAKQLGLHTAIETSGYLGDRIDDRYLPFSISAARHKEFKPRKISFRHRTRSGSNTALCETPAIGKPVWVRFTFVPGLTDDPANVDGIAKFVAPRKDVEWVEVQPFHQLGAFKWKAMNLEYKLVHTTPPTPDLVDRVLEQFRLFWQPAFEINA